MTSTPTDTPTEADATDGPAAFASTDTAAVAVTELTIGGMTCASCAARVEKKLNRMDGVTATVNYATEKARIEHPRGSASAS